MHLPEVLAPHARMSPKKGLPLCERYGHPRGKSEVFDGRMCKLYSSDDVQGPLEETPELKKQMEEALHVG